MKSIQEVGAIDDRLLALLKEKLNTDEQKLFVDSFKMFLRYGNDPTAFVVNFDDVWKWIGFTRKNNAKRLLISKYVNKIDYIEQTSQTEGGFTSDENEVLLPKEQNFLETTTVSKNGRPTVNILLTVQAFKDFCMSADTPEGKRVRNYYLTMENINHQYILQLVHEEKIRLLEETKLNEAKKSELERHNVLKEAHKNQKVVYVMKLKTFENGHHIIKIGQTDNIAERNTALNAKFHVKGSFIDIFPCDDHIKFEKFILKHKKLEPFKYIDAIFSTENETEKVTSTETFLFKSMDEYASIKRFIQENIKGYYGNVDEQIRLNESEMRLLDKKARSDILSKLSLVQDSEAIKQILLNMSENLENSDYIKTVKVYNSIGTQTDDITNTTESIDTEPPVTVQKLVITHQITDGTDVINKTKKTEACGSLVQMYSPDKKLLKVFDGLTETTRQVKGSSLSHLKYSATNKTIYMGHRWFLIDRTDPSPNEERDIGETVSVNERKSGLIAMLNVDKTFVEQVFARQVDACKFLNQKASVICGAVKFGKPCLQHIFMLWTDVSEELQNVYLESVNFVLPEVHSAKGSRIERIDINTGSVVEVHDSITDIQKRFRMSPASLKDAIKNGTAKDGFKWRTLA